MAFTSGRPKTGRSSHTSFIGRGASNTEIADSLFVSEATVKSHIGHIFTKLDLRDRAAAIVFAFDHGLVAAQG